MSLVVCVSQTSADISCALKLALESPHLRESYQTAGINRDRSLVISSFCSRKFPLLCGNEKAQHNAPLSFGHIKEDGSRQSELNLSLQDILTAAVAHGRKKPL